MTKATRPLLSKAPPGSVPSAATAPALPAGGPFRRCATCGDPGSGRPIACHRRTVLHWTKPGLDQSQPVSPGRSPRRRNASSTPAETYAALIKTNRGDITGQPFAAKDAPNTVNNFVFLAREGFYDGLTFHRVVKPETL